MDHQNLEIDSGRSSSIGRRIGASSSSRRRSLPAQLDHSSESDAASEAGDIGDRALHSNRASASGRSQFSLDNSVQDGVDARIQSVETQNDEKEVPWLLEYITCLLSLAVFGILGELARYGLRKLFGPDGIGATRSWDYMYLDLCPNMVGSFLMGWFAFVFKEDVIKFSDQLAIGLTTGFLGSFTTFSGWNQQMLDLSVKGQWVFVVLGFCIGLLLVAGSITIGISSANWLKTRSFSGVSTCNHSCISNKFHSVLTFMTTLLLMLVLLWSLFGSLAKKNFKTGSSEAQLFLACMVGPFGVWIRWFLARLNGRGFGKNGMLKWMPFGTLAANVLAACLMAALATSKKAVKTKNCYTMASAIQFALGCLSTVSTFIAEFHAMGKSEHPWRAYVYAIVTFVICFVLGTLIYSVPVWAWGDH